MSGTADAATTPGHSRHGTILGQPRGLATLFLTEMWERFTYYGMRSVLILFIVAPASLGGLGIDDQTASSIYGMYIAGTYVLAPLGGWLADRLIGARRALVIGGLLIMIGNTLLTLSDVRTFFLGLLIIVLGVGLLKPNISAIVAQLYPEGGSRRDAGFSIFYVGINIGAFLGSLLVPLCAARFGWRWAFGLPAVGMLLGLLQFMITRQWLGDAGLDTERRQSRASWLAVIVFIGLLATVTALMMTGTLSVHPGVAATALSWLIALLAAAYFLYLLLFAGLTAAERGRVYVMAALFSGYAAFFAAFEQGGASFNLFADRYTDLHLLGWRMPAGVLQATTPLVTILFAPVFAALWIALGKRGKDPSPPAKFATGFALQSLGFLVMYVASQYVVAGQQVLPTWLLFTYLLQEWGDLCIGPVGLSAMSKLAPRRFVGQVMGVWFLALALGNNLSGQVSRLYDAANLESLPNLFMGILWCGLGAAGILWLLTPTLKRLMAGAK